MKTRKGDKDVSRKSSCDRVENGFVLREMVRLELRVVFRADTPREDASWQCLHLPTSRAQLDACGEVTCRAGVRSWPEAPVRAGKAVRWPDWGWQSKSSCKKGMPTAVQFQVGKNKTKPKPVPKEFGGRLLRRCENLCTAQLKHHQWLPSQRKCKRLTGRQGCH